MQMVYYLQHDIQQSNASDLLKCYVMNFKHVPNEKLL
jgi:hypothetical protein